MKKIVTIVMTVFGLLMSGPVAFAEFGYEVTLNPGQEIDVSKVGEIGFKDSAGFAYTKCFMKYNFVAANHPNKKEIYALLLMGRALNIPVGCVINTDTDVEADPGSSRCWVNHCSIGN